VSRLELRFDTFVEEFSTIIQRHGHARHPRTEPWAAAFVDASYGGEIKVVPAIDVMLVLLVIFMDHGADAQGRR